MISSEDILSDLSDVGNSVGMENPCGCLWVFTVGMGVGCKHGTHALTHTRVGMGVTMMEMLNALFQLL